MNKFLILKTKLTPPLEGVRGEVFVSLTVTSSGSNIVRVVSRCVWRSITNLAASRYILIIRYAQNQDTRADARLNSLMASFNAELDDSSASIFKPLFCTFYSLFTIPFYGMIFDNFTATNLYTK